MTIDEAITIINACITGYHEYTEDQCFEAFSLGIEALKVIKRQRLEWPLAPVKPLPGETEQPT